MNLYVNVASESALTVTGHGVHSAYLEDLSSLRRVEDINVSTNRPGRADIQHVHTVGPYAMSLLSSGRGRVLTAHLTPRSLAGSLRGDRLWHGAFVRYMRWCYNQAHVVLAVSDMDATDLVRMGVRRPILVVPNSVDVAAIHALTRDRARARDRLGIGQDAFVVLGVGQVQPRKGVDVFTACARSMPEALFYWVGGMPFGPLSAQRGAMNTLLSTPLGNLLFTGAVARTAVFDHLAAADLFFLPSWHEGCPMAVLEAAAAGLPIVLRDLHTYRAQFGDSCAYGADHTFVGLLRRLITDGRRRDALSAKASRMAEERFDSGAKASRLLEIYTNVVAEISKRGLSPTG